MRFRSVGVVGLVLVLMPLGAAGAQGEARPEPEPVVHTAQPTPPGPVPGGLDDTASVDDVLAVVAERLFQLGADAGFVSQRTDYPGRSIAVTWHGEVPQAVLDYVRERPFGVAIFVASGAKYSRAQGDAARDRLLDDAIALEVGIVSASVNPDGSGLTLGVTLQRVSDAHRAGLAAAAGLDLQDITVHSSVPPLSPPTEPTPAHHAAESDGDISAIADRLFALAGPRFAGLRVDEAHRRIAAYWAGDIPAAAAAYAARKPAGITIQLDDQAPFTRLSLQASAERVANSEMGRKIGVSSVAARGVGTPGLHVDVKGDVPPPALRRAVAQLAGLPEDAITYTPYNELVPLSAPRK